MFSAYYDLHNPAESVKTDTLGTKILMWEFSPCMASSVYSRRRHHELEVLVNARKYLNAKDLFVSISYNFINFMILLFYYFNALIALAR